MFSIHVHDYDDDAVADILGPYHATDPWFIFRLFVAAVVFYHHVVTPLIGVRFNIIKGMMKYYGIKTCEISFKDVMCPNRMARFYKCSKRCSAQRNFERCAISESAAKLARLHLPPPLPWKKKKQSKKVKNIQGKQECDPSNESEVLSERTEKPQILPSVAKLVAPRPVTPLLDPARMQNWDLIRNAATRRAAKQRDTDGLMPLHWAVSGAPPVDVIETLLKVYPSAARKLDKEASSPLHFAAHYSASPKVIEALLKVYPQAAALQDRYGRSPLYHLVDKCSGMESLKLLVQANPSMITVPCLRKEHRDLPLSRTTATLTPLYMAWAHVVRESKSLKKKGSKCKKLEKAQLLLEGAFFHARNVNPLVPKDYHFIAATIAFDQYLPEQVLSMAIAHNPKELRHSDKQGRLPLAQAAATSQHSRARANAVILEVLAAYKEAASQRDHQGNYPLQLALKAGKTWISGVSELFAAFPQAMNWTDTTSGLPAFATVASAEAEASAMKMEPEDAGQDGWRAMRSSDPYNLLTSKQREILERASKRQDQGRKDQDAAHLNPDNERLTTILDFLRADPAAISATY